MYLFLDIYRLVASPITHSPRFPTSNNSILHGFLTPIPIMKGSISYIDNQIDLLGPESLNYIKTLLEEDLEEVIREEIWAGIWEHVHKSSICARHGYSMYTLLHKGSVVSVIYDCVSPACDRFQQSPAAMFWLCPSPHNYWTEILNTLSEVTGEKLEQNALSGLFGVFHLVPSLPTTKKDGLAFVTLLAIRLIFTNWISTISPSHTSWIRGILYFLILGKIRLSFSGSSNKFGKIWGLYFQFIKRIHFPLIPDWSIFSSLEGYQLCVCYGMGDVLLTLSMSITDTVYYWHWLMFFFVIMFCVFWF